MWLVSKQDVQVLPLLQLWKAIVFEKVMEPILSMQNSTQIRDLGANGKGMIFFNKDLLAGTDLQCGTIVGAENFLPLCFCKCYVRCGYFKKKSYLCNPK